ncbi:autotransporter assembly complex family protein [Nitrosovibrio sp. Nv17]|uniref:autotransporter assembly complex protein TamA n=1 Tax=Nitrosovibrio sp. Nv17 TaxID=1855339 RepID=UPI0009084FF4|nr:autotransporter assembly complex family protein [Nitrosovibrio sp. Nv17]SFW15425.1 autotransporter secretion outer membrane protein TamA [Nitrosovibrio sp. Nv17]
MPGGSAADSSMPHRSETGDGPSVIISAPPPLQGLLETHFQLPVEPIADDIARAALMRRARQEMGELLATEGYFTPSLSLHAAPGAVPVLTIEPGVRTLVAEVRIDFKGDLAIDTPERRARIESLRTAWSLGVGSPFRSGAWEEAKAALISSVSRDDYVAAVIDESRAEVDPVSARVRLSVAVDSGPAFRYGPVVIKGLDRYDQKLIHNLVPFQAGDPYRRDQLQAFQARLQNLIQFGSALVSVEPDVAAHQAVPVEVALSEAQSQRVSLGGGYSSNTGVRGEASYANHNFLGRALRLGSLLRLEQKRQSLSVSVDGVVNREGRWYSLGAIVDRTSIQDLVTLREKVVLNRNQRLGNTETRIGVNWQREDRDPKGGLQQTNETLVLDGQLRYRSVDDPLFPRDGSMVEVRVGGGSRHVLSDQSFLRTYFRHQYWHPVGSRHVLFLRAEAGYTFAGSRFGIPQEYLFRAGGIQSVRGYAFQSLGVREGSAVVGATAMATGTVEYNHWITPGWGAAVFVDAGDAADGVRHLDPVVGYGGGVRWRSPVGPLALDLARGHRDGKLRLHFSIAVAF